MQDLLFQAEARLVWMTSGSVYLFLFYLSNKNSKIVYRDVSVSLQLE